MDLVVSAVFFKLTRCKTCTSLWLFPGDMFHCFGFCRCDRWQKLTPVVKQTRSSFLGEALSNFLSLIFLTPKPMRSWHVRIESRMQAKVRVVYCAMAGAIPVCYVWYGIVLFSEKKKTWRLTSRWCKITLYIPTNVFSHHDVPQLFMTTLRMGVRKLRWWSTQNFLWWIYR